MAVKVYTQADCGQCRMIKTLMKNKHISFEEIQDIEVMRANGIDHTPTIELEDGTRLVGKDMFPFVNNA